MLHTFVREGWSVSDLAGDDGIAGVSVCCTALGLVNRPGSRVCGGTPHIVKVRYGESDRSRMCEECQQRLSSGPPHLRVGRVMVRPPHQKWIMKAALRWL
jgi:hypothetical protein